MRAALTILILVTLVSGCASNKFGRAEIAKRAKVELIGKTKTDILACAGIPARTQQSDNLELISYSSGGDTNVYGAGGVGSTSGGGVISIQDRSCEVTFVLNNGIVERVNYTGRTGGLITEGEQCAFVLQNCVAK